jgi:hypothetical protein
MITADAEFAVDGVIYCRGEEAKRYSAGDKVSVIQELTDSMVKVLVLNGEAKGYVVYTDRELLIFR